MITIVQIQTKWWLIEGNIRNWIALWQQDSKSIPQLNTAILKVANIMANKRTIIVESVNILFLACPKWKPINIVIWTSKNKENHELFHFDNVQQAYNENLMFIISTDTRNTKHLAEMFIARTVIKSLQWNKFNTSFFLLKIFRCF